MLSGLVTFGVLFSVVSGTPAAAAHSHRKTHHRESVRAAHVKVDTAVLRSSPTRKSKATALLDAGRKVRILKHQDGWVKLRLASGTEGWVRSDLLKVSHKPVDVSEVEERHPSEESVRHYAHRTRKSPRHIAVAKSIPTSQKHVAEHKTPPAILTKLSPEILLAARQPFLRDADIRSTVKLPPTTVDNAVPGSNPETVKSLPDTTLPTDESVDTGTRPDMPKSDTGVDDKDPVPVEPEPDIPSEPAPSVPTPATPTWNDNIVRSALSYRGAPYRLGATGRYGAFDCSSFTRHILGQNGASLPRTASEQYHHGEPVARESLLPGDLVFFKNTYKRGISHVGIYIGNDKFIHASNRRMGVTITSLSAAYYARHYAGARRVH
jgi:cell wall-associated NlpC family hydrolase